MALKTRTDLVTEALANLGIVQQADASGTRARAELVSEAAACLGLNQQAYSGGTRSRAELVTEAFAVLGFVYQADASATRTRAEWATETLACLGITYQADASATRTRVDWANETLALLGVIQQPDAGATHNRAELINNVLFILGPLAAGQTASAEDSAAIDQRIDTVLADLNARVIATVASTAAIPAAWFDAISIIVANVCKEKYGVIGDEAAKLQSEALAAEKKLRTLTRTGVVDEILPSIIGDLNARNVATISNIAAIPGAWLPALADIAAEYCKGKFEVDPTRSQELTLRAKEAERKLRIMTQAPLVDEKLPSIVGELNARMVATIADIGAIPGAWFPALADIAAESVKGKFEIAADLSQQLSARAQVAERKLKVITQAPLVDEMVPSVLAELSARAIITIATPFNVPTQVFPAVAAVLANTVKGKFELPIETMQRVAAEAVQAEKKLILFNAPVLIDEKLPSIIAELNARGVATVADLSAIPTAWFPALADIVAESCRGRFEVAQDIAARVLARAPLAERTLKNLTRTYIVDRNVDPTLADLAARNIIHLVDQNYIPDEWFIHIAAILADRCKGKGFDLDLPTLQRVTAEGAQAIMELRELTRGRPSYLPMQATYF